MGRCEGYEEETRWATNWASGGTEGAFSQLAGGGVAAPGPDPQRSGERWQDGQSSDTPSFIPLCPKGSCQGAGSEPGSGQSRGPGGWMGSSWSSHECHPLRMDFEQASPLPSPPLFLPPSWELSGFWCELLGEGRVWVILTLSSAKTGFLPRNMLRVTCVPRPLATPVPFSSFTGRIIFLFSFRLSSI